MLRLLTRCVRQTFTVVIQAMSTTITHHAVIVHTIVIQRIIPDVVIHGVEAVLVRVGMLMLRM